MSLCKKQTAGFYSSHPHFHCPVFAHLCAIRYEISQNAPYIFSNAAHSWYECDLLFRICKAHLRKSKAHFHIRQEDKIFQGELSPQQPHFPSVEFPHFANCIFYITHNINHLHHSTTSKLTYLRPKSFSGRNTRFSQPQYTV